MADKPLLAEAPGSTGPQNSPWRGARPRLGFREACRALGPDPASHPVPQGTVWSSPRDAGPEAVTSLRADEGLLQPLSARADCPWGRAVRGLTSGPQAALRPGATAQLPEPGHTCLDADPVPHRGPRTTSPVSAMPCREQARGHFIVLCGLHSALPASAPSCAPVPMLTLCGLHSALPASEPSCAPVPMLTLGTPPPGSRPDSPALWCL